MTRNTSSSSSPNGHRMERTARLRWVPIVAMRVSPLAQRELNVNRVNRIAAVFDPEQIGAPTMNERESHFYIIDGQHRIEALKQMGWGDQQVQCWTYVGLTMEEEAEKFLTLNDTLSVDAFSKFRVGVQAGRDEDCDIDRVVRAQGLVVSRDHIDGAISAVGTLRRVYHRDGPPVLARSLALIRDAYGDAGLVASIIDGLGMLQGRYNGELDELDVVKRLAGAMGGVSGLLNKAEKIRRETGHAKGQCVAAAAVDTINGNARGNKKLPSWWRNAS